jgi:ribosome-associated heat shock protein Hsp15
MRLDVWLDVACLLRTRSEAQRACRGGKIHVNGQAAKPHRDIEVGDEIRITRPSGRRQVVVVRDLRDTHVTKALARNLYEDATPPPTPDEIEIRQMNRLARTAAGPSRSPHRRDRRLLRRLKGRDD